MGPAWAVPRALDRAGIQAEIASLKADQKSVQSDEPTIAAELDALDPRIAAIKAARTEADKKRTELEQSELEDQRRTTELFEAIAREMVSWPPEEVREVVQTDGRVLLECDLSQAQKPPPYVRVTAP